MSATPRASTSVIVAGISAILAGALVTLLNVATLILFSSARFSKSSLFPAFMLPVLIFFWIFLLLCGLFLSVVGIQVIRLRNWARISLLVIAGLMLFFGVMGIAVIFVTLFVSTPADPRVSRGLLAAMLALIYGIPTAISTTSSPYYEASVRAVFEKMNIPNFPSNTEQMLHYSRYFNLIGLLIPIAIVVTLFMARGKFYEAANRAAQGSLPTTPTPSMKFPVLPSPGR